MLTLYFSGTGNTAYIARRFSEKMDAACFSIEDDADFAAEIAAHEVIAICYPVYGSRVPRIMREFVVRHRAPLAGKRLVILVTQLTFSGDGARVLCDLLPAQHVQVIYAERFFMPNNVCNFALLRQTRKKSVERRVRLAQKTMDRVCRDIARGKIRRRGFCALSRLLGKVQGSSWQGDSRSAAAATGSIEHKAQRDVRIAEDCTACGRCVQHCPMKNLQLQDGVVQLGNCTVCYRCVNLCPQRAITVYFHAKPRWQYGGIDAGGVGGGLAGA